jgi:hypothetical protein
MLGDEMARLYERARWPWVLAGAVPALFVLFFLLLTLFADPQHDDFCFSYRYAEMGWSSRWPASTSSSEGA